MKNLRFTVFFAAIFISQILFAQVAEKWTLEKCIDYAFKNNISIRQADMTATMADNQLLQSKLNLLPSVNASASYDFNFGNSINPISYSFSSGNSQTAQAGLQGSLTLFNGLQQINTIKKSKYDLLASKYDYENAKSNIGLNIASAFLQILLNGEINAVATQQQAITADQKQNVQKRFAAGALPETSVLEVDAQLARDESNVVNTKGIYDLSVLALKQLLQLNDDQPFDVDITKVDADNLQGLTDLTSLNVYSYAVKNQPSIKSADARWMSAQMAQKVATGYITPTIAVNYNLLSGYANTPNETLSLTPPYLTNLPPDAFGTQLKNNFREIVAFQVTVPLFNKGQVFLNMSNAKLQQQIRQLDVENAKNKLRQDIEQAYTNAKVAAENYAANKKSYESSQKAYYSLQSRFQSGLATNFDMQQSKYNMVSAESEMIKAKYTYVFRIKILDFYQGKALTLN